MPQMHQKPTLLSSHWFDDNWVVNLYSTCHGVGWGEVQIETTTGTIQFTLFEFSEKNLGQE